MSASEINLESVVEARPTTASCELEGEAVILNLDSGLYHGLNAVGSRIWELVQESRSVASVRDVLLEEFDVDDETCRQDLLGILEEMQRAGLIEVRGS